MADFANIKPALFCQKWRIDHVYRVGKTPHETGKHSSRNWFNIQFRRRALNLNRDIVEIVMRQLANKRTQF